MAVGNRKP